MRQHTTRYAFIDTSRRTSGQTLNEVAKLSPSMTKHVLSESSISFLKYKGFPVVFFAIIIIESEPSERFFKEKVKLTEFEVNVL